MDYDYWLQKGAGCFDEYYKADNDELYNLIGRKGWKSIEDSFYESYYN